MEVVNAVVLCFKTGELGEIVNENLVALTPNVCDPKSICQLRPIGCCNFIYKVISKILVKRLKPLHGELISPQQSAFVGSRLIQDNLVVAQEAFHFLKKKKVMSKNGFAIKLYMNEAYDRDSCGLEFRQTSPLIFWFMFLLGLSYYVFGHFC